MLFADRDDAGRRLAERLSGYAGIADGLVVALPRGGVVVGRVVADALRLPLDIVVPRKIGAESNPEYAIGAVTEEGDVVWNEAERRQADPAYLTAEVAKQKEEAARRLATYRAGLVDRTFEGRTVIVVDDGVATGLTMRAALATVRRGRPARTVVAVPVCPPGTLVALEAAADVAIVLELPRAFMAIGAFYADFPQVEDEEVLRLMRG
ncbi:MAG TPA: phosphoribosyltransferase family protein [Candidatus Eisenbacteria bacterium]|nr:phosphoribosyltransferase family protein [Candidatus Eisenbacteria bacterium]